MMRRDKLLDSIMPEPNSGCWLWAKNMFPNGYGRFYWAGVWAVAHRATYEEFVGSIPDGLEIDHLCRTRACVNPDHLEPVTTKENLRRCGATAAYVAAMRARTHCKHGHEYATVGVNIKGTRRNCRACNKRRIAEYQARMEQQRDPGLAAAMADGCGPSNPRRVPRAAKRKARGHQVA